MDLNEAFLAGFDAAFEETEKTADLEGTLMAGFIDELEKLGFFRGGRFSTMRRMGQVAEGAAKTRAKTLAAKEKRPVAVSETAKSPEALRGLMGKARARGFGRESAPQKAMTSLSNEAGEHPVREKMRGNVSELIGKLHKKPTAAAKPGETLLEHHGLGERVSKAMGRSETPWQRNLRMRAGQKATAAAPAARSAEKPSAGGPAVSTFMEKLRRGIHAGTKAFKGEE